MTIRMAYEMVMPYHLHMPSYFLETFTEYPCMETASMAVFAPRMHGVIVILFPTINPPFYSKIIFLVTDKYRIAEYLQHSLWENLYLSAHHNDGRW